MKPERDRWIVCHEYVAGPFTAERAGRELAAIEHIGVCQAEHSVVVSETKPPTAALPPREGADRP